MTDRNSLTIARTAILAAGMMGLAIVAGPVAAAEQAQGQGQDDAAEYASLSGIKLSLADAVAAAEKQFGGKAVNAALDNEQQAGAFEVELMTETGSRIVAVDGQTGAPTEVADSSSGENGGAEDSE